MEQKIRTVVNVYIESNGKIVAGRGIIELLKFIEEKGSLNSAAKAMNMNYRKAWSKIKKVEQKLGMQLLERNRGRKGCKLTESGKEIIRLYDDCIERLRACRINLIAS